MPVGTPPHAQFQFLADQPLNASDTARRSSRNDEGDAPPRPAARGYAAPEPEKKGFFGRLFSRDAEPVRSQPQPGYYDRRETTAQPVAYAQPGTTYVRDGVRFSDPAGNHSPAAAAPTRKR